MAVTFEWRGQFSNSETNALHAEAFGTRLFDEAEWNWEQQVVTHSLGWVVARDIGQLLGFLNVIWDGVAHAWIQDVMVAESARRMNVGTRLVAEAIVRTREAGCEWLHVDFDDHLRPFYFDACGFTPTTAGLIALQRND